MFYDSSSATQEIILFLGKCQAIMRCFLFRRGKRKGKVEAETEKEREEEERKKGTHQHFDSKG